MPRRFRNFAENISMTGNAMGKIMKEKIKKICARSKKI